MAVDGPWHGRPFVPLLDGRTGAVVSGAVDGQESGTKYRHKSQYISSVSVDDLRSNRPARKACSAPVSSIAQWHKWPPTLYREVTVVGDVEDAELRGC